MKTIMTDVWKTPENKLPEDIEICNGDFVRIKRFEHFRVIVTQIISQNQFVGVVSNNLVFPTPYQIDDLVSFNRDNILYLKKLDRPNVYKCC
tara:strand:+ start:440 stop:715 length:276 start_codon:yes stop_codon:yes gene_type:complete